MSPTTFRVLLFVLFAASGFSGLIYESIWARYLQLFLGHAAYAQTLVLVIFMGGMAVGAWLAGRYSHRWRNLLLCYAVVEGLIALFGVAFHTVFVGAMGIVFESIIPNLGSPILVQSVKWSFAALLILPQSLLLGMTFPLMSTALVRRFPESSGRAISMLYFTNSLGAALGVLVAGFALIAWSGLPGTILTAAGINVWLGLLVWVLSRVPDYQAPPFEPVSSPARVSAPSAFLLIAAITGTASFMYEIGWIRMLSLVMGSSTHAFELMLSAFILGLALGSLWIRGRIEKIKEPMMFLGIVQVAMGALALATIATYGATFDWMSLLLKTVTQTQSGYIAFNVASHAIAMVIMVPTTFCAGMTLPLITYHLLAGGVGEGAIGRVYAANTLGAIVGVVLTVHVALPLLGLKGVIVAGAALDILLGIYIIHRLAPSTQRQRYAIAGAGAASLLLAVVFTELDATRMAAGVFRNGEATIEPNSEVIYHRDGKTATVSVIRYETSLTLSTNGKADASIGTTPDPQGAGNGDHQTQVLLGAIPVAVRPDARTAAVIGFGSGLSTHVLLGSPTMERVTTVEIEAAMIEGAREFMPYVARAFEDSRSVVVIEDAKTFFASGQQLYDVIVSEPSNPWVSGVAGLFSREFYAMVKRHLTPGGVFCQWIHLYEIDMALVATVLLALEESFPHYDIYAANDVDLLIIASDQPVVPHFDVLLKTPALADELATIAVETEDDLQVRRVASGALLAPLFRSYATRPNSDFFPVLDLLAVRSRFMGASAAGYLQITTLPVPMIEMLDPRAPRRSARTNVSLNRQLTRAAMTHFAMAVRDYVVQPDFRASHVVLRQEGQDILLSMLAKWQRCGDEGEDDFWIRNLLDLASTTVPFLSRSELDGMWNTLAAQSCDRIASGRRARWFDLVRAVSARDPDAMLTLAREILEEGTKREDVRRLAHIGQAARAMASDERLSVIDAGRGEPPNQDQFRRLRYLVTVAMTASLALDDPAGALVLWTDNGGSLLVNDQPPPELRLLMALAGERQRERDALAVRN